MISRSFNPLILLNNKKSVLLLGPRGTGKSALLRSVRGELSATVSIDLLRGKEFQKYLQNPERLGEELREWAKNESGKLVVLIDEIQKVPSLLDEIHSLIEEFAGRIAFLLTGSSARKLKRGGANLLAGRAIAKHLFPLSTLETGLILSKALQFGTLPGVYLGSEDFRNDVLESYVSTYLREEIQQESLVRGVDRFSRFLEFAGQLNGEPVNFSKLGKQTGIAGKTAAEYFGILSDTLLVHEVPGWSHSVKKQLLQASKFYFFDCGVLNAINGLLRIELKPSSFIYGKLFETFIVSQLIAANSYLSLGLRFFYWRDKNDREVDLIIARNVAKPLLAIEIKSGPNPDEDDCSGFVAFSEDHPKVPRICICTAERPFERGNIRFLPWHFAIARFSELIPK